MRILLSLVLLSLVATPLLADADLILFLDQPLENVRAGSQFSVVFRLENAGPDHSGPIAATVDVPPGLELVGLSNLNACEGMQPMRCHVDSVGAGSRTSLQLHFRPLLTDRTIEIKASVSADADRNASNNSVTKTIRVSTAPDLYVELPGGYDFRRVDPGEVFSVDLHASNANRPELNAKDVSLHLDVENATVEGIDAKGWTCQTGETTADCSAPEAPSGVLVALKLRATTERDGRSVRIRARITSPAPDFDPSNNTDSYDLAIYRWISVTSTGDDGEGSLRKAIVDSLGCSPGPCRIVFEIPGPVPDEGWFTIRPRSPLPAIDADRVIVLATSQTWVTGDTNPAGPEVFLDGSDAGPADGLHAIPGCDFAVQGLAIGNFRGFGLRLEPRRNYHCFATAWDRRLITENHFGTDPTGAQAAPNMRGLLSAASQTVIAKNVISGNERGGVWESGGHSHLAGNRIGVAADGVTPLPNGASGVFVTPRSFDLQVVGNVISYNRHMGVAISRGSTAAVHRNSMRDNGGLGIDIGLDDHAAPPEDAHDIPAPVLHSARYDASTDSTIVSGRIYAKPAFLLSFTVGLYANDDPDGDGETYLGEIEPKTGEDAFTFTVQGDLRGQWINAAVTRVNWIVFADEEPSAQWFEPSSKSTSELSAAVLVPGVTSKKLT